MRIIAVEAAIPDTLNPGHAVRRRFLHAYLSLA